MTAFRPFTLLFIALSCYTLGSSSKAIRHENMQKMSAPAANQISINSDSYHVSNKQQQSSHSKPLSREEGRHKRSQFDFLNDNSANSNNILNELSDETEENVMLAQGANPNPNKTNLQRDSAGDDYDVESLPPFTYFLLLQKLRELQSQEPTYRVRTPRLGRSIDLQLLDDIGTSAGLLGRAYDIGGTLTRQNKKSVPFKPRLGKRTQHCV